MAKHVVSSVAIQMYLLWNKESNCTMIRTLGDEKSDQYLMASTNLDRVSTYRQSCEKSMPDGDFVILRGEFIAEEEL